MPSAQHQQPRTNGSRGTTRGGSSDRMKQIFGPLLAGLAIDLIDLATFGPVGIYTGLLIGGTVGYLLAPHLGFERRSWWISALLTGVYCTLPLTAFIPAATFAAIASRLLSAAPEEPSQTADPALRREDAIEVDYEVVDDDTHLP